MSDINEEIARSFYNRSSDQIMSNEQKQFFDNLTLIRILEEKNRELQERINKAINYIDKQIPCIHDEEILDKLLNILKGDNK